MKHGPVEANFARVGRSTAITIAIAALLAAAGCGRRPAATEPADPPPSAAERVRVVEAHSLIIDGQRVRLSNADAPELFPNARCWAEAILAKQAFFTVSEAVNGGRDVLLRPLGRENRWGQALAEVTIDGTDLGDLLYQQGLATRPTGQRFSWCGELNLQAAGAPPLDPLWAAGRR